MESWKKRPKWQRVLVYVIAALIALTIIGALLPSEKKDKTTKETTTAAETTIEPSVTGKVVGTFHRDCVICDERLKQYVKTSNVWCGWEDGGVRIHVRMKNTSAEHVTVNWHPSYIIARGGEHGTGLTSEESDGFDAGEVRELIAKEDPEGVVDGAKIAACKPSFSTIQSG